MLKFKFFKLLGKYISFDTLKRIIKFLDHYVIGLFSRLDSHHLFLAAAGIAYSLLLSIVPMLLILFSILGNLIDTQTIEMQINTLIDTIIPYPQYASYVKQFIMSRIPEVIEYKTLAGYFGAFGLLFTSSWLFSSMRTVLNGIFGVTEEKSEWIGLLRDFGMVILFVVFILLLIIVLPGLNILLNAAEEIEYLQSLRVSDFQDFIFSFLSILIIFILFFTFYYLIPYEKLGKLVPAVAALWATILWEVAKRIFGLYVFNFLNENKVYGAFILIVVIVFWLFYSSILFIIGAQIGQLFRERRNQKQNGQLV